MKVILLADVKKVGKKDQIIEVSDGYAKNFLIAKKLAVPVTATSKAVLQKQQDDEAARQAKLKQEALELATNDNERYLIHYNRAVMYYNNQDFKSALNCAKDAQAIKDDETTKALINDIEAMLKT